MNPILVSGLYQLLILLVLAGMSVQDIKHRRISKKARLLYLPVVLCAVLPAFLMSKSWRVVLLSSALGAAAGLLVTEGCNLMLRKRNGGRPLFGGADVWLFSYMGWVYGAFGVLSLLFLSNLGYGVTAAILRKRRGVTRVPLPLVPFLFVSTAVYAAVQIITL